MTPFDRDVARIYQVYARRCQLDCETLREVSEHAEALSVRKRASEMLIRVQHEREYFAARAMQAMGIE